MFLRRFSVLALALALFATACGGSDGSIEIEDARYRLSREDLGASYFTVTNGTDDIVVLEGASAPGVGRIELHESMQASDGTMAMEARPDGFEIGPGETVSLEPGGKHLMLFSPPASGGDLELTLDFDSEPIVVKATFDEAASAAAGDDSMDDMEMDDMEMDDDEG